MEKRARGQCFHCDEPFHPAQECKSKLYKLLGEELEEIEEGSTVVECEETMQCQEGPKEISLNALAGSKTSSTLRLLGSIMGRMVNILIDSGSTHRFVNANLVKQLKLNPILVPPLLVIVIDGTSMMVDTVCKGLPFEIQNHKFLTDMRPFPLRESNVILGVGWLKMHNPITLDYQKLSISIMKEGKLVKLQGTQQQGSLQTISMRSMDKLLHSGKGLTHGCIFMMTSTSQQTADNNDISPMIQPVLHKFQDVFREPEGIPLIREHDH